MVFGTRPEYIKLYPLIKKAQTAYQDKFKVSVCSTGQHQSLLGDLLINLPCKFDYDLQIMKENQSLNQICSSLFSKLPQAFKEVKPDLVIVQGDTSSAAMTAIAAFNQQIPVAHIEAGLRTNDRFNPYPEEINRSMISRLADYHFVPTDYNRLNLERENLKSSIFVVGNTVIDTLQITLQENSAQDIYTQLNQNFNNSELDLIKDKYVVVTTHRRESFGVDLENICMAISELAEMNRDLWFILPVHENPNVKSVIYSKLQGTPNILLIPPQNYLNFSFLLKNAHLILSDSGGIQEEATFLGKRVLVMRKVTERQEAIEAGINILTGTNKEKIIEHFQTLHQSLKDTDNSRVNNSLYGDGQASEKILDKLSNLL